MKKGAISILAIISILWIGCSLSTAMKNTEGNKTREIISDKDYGDNINPLYSLRNKFI